MLASTFREMARLVLAGWRRMLAATGLMVVATAAVVLVLLPATSSAWSSSLEQQRAAMDAAAAAGLPADASSISDVLGTFGGVLGLALVGALLVSLVVLAGATMVVRAGVVSGETLAESAWAGIRLLPWTSSQASVALAPPLVVLLGAWAAALVHPLLALPVVMLAYAVMFACTPWMLLALAGSSLGDREWLPRESWRLVRARPWPLLGVTFVGMMAVGAVSSVLVVPGGILLLGPAPLVAIGVGIIVAVQVAPPMLLAAAMYRVVGGVHPGAAAPVAASVPVEQLLVARMRVEPSIERFEAIIDPQAAWGTWIDTLGQAGDVELRIAWSVGTIAPRLLVADAGGTWSEPEQPTEARPAIRLHLPVPRAYLHLESRAEAQQVVLELVRSAPAAQAS